MNPKDDNRKGAFFRLRPEIDQLIETHKYANNGNRTDFIEEAIRHYCLKVDTDNNREVFGNAVLDIISSTLEQMDSRQARLLFKIAGEISFSNYLLAIYAKDLSDGSIQELREYAYNKVRKQHGLVKLEEFFED